MPPPAKYKLKGKRGPDCFWAMSAAALSRHAGGAAASRAGKPTREIYKMPKVKGKQQYQAYMEIFPGHEDETVSRNANAVAHVVEGLQNSASAFEKLPDALRDEFALFVQTPA